MEFALQVLFQTFFLEVSRAGISVRTRRTFCGRLYTKHATYQKKLHSCAILRRKRSNVQHRNAQRSARSPQMKGGLCMIDTTQTSFDKNKLEFAIFCIENVAKKLNQNPRDTFDTLTKSSDILMSYIVASYDVLHTQGKDYIVNDIISCMKEKGVKV